MEKVEFNIPSQLPKLLVVFYDSLTEAIKTVYHTNVRCFTTLFRLRLNCSLTKLSCQLSARNISVALVAHFVPVSSQSLCSRRGISMSLVFTVMRFLLDSPRRCLLMRVI